MTLQSDPWCEAMKHGHFARAWSICDRAIRARRGMRQHHLPRHLQNIWNGAPLEGRVLIRCYHGLGDTLQFARYIPLVSQLASETIVWMQPALIDFLRDPLRGARLLPLHDGAPEVDYDVDVEIMELPHAFRTSLDTVPPLLTFDGSGRRDPDDPPRVGIVWTSGDWDIERNVPFPLLDGLLRSRITPVLLEERAAHWQRRRFRWTPPVDTIGALARAMCDCDLVITVDTMAAHLAGALGVPTWTLLRHDADWRWLTGRRDSPWYPSMRLYRQPAPGAWAPVLDEVVTDLMVHSRSSTARSSGLSANRTTVIDAGAIANRQ